MTRSEISHIFIIADTKREGMIERKEWNQFYQSFVSNFDKFDVDENGLLNEEEFTKAIEDVDI